MSERDPVDTAWKIHSTLVDWTGKVDTKAAFMLAIESALLGSVVNLSADNRIFGSMQGFLVHFFYWVGLILVAAAVVMSALVVRPRLRSKKLPGEVADNYIYFGHLRHWSPEELAETLKTEDPLPVLTRQLVNASKIAWTKHLLVQRSIAAATFGAACLIVAGLSAG